MNKGRLCGAARLMKLDKLLPLLVVLLIVGCAGAKPTEPQAAVTPAASRVLADTDWELTLLEGQPLVPDTFISLRFEAGAFSGSAGCNRYGGEYVAAEDGSLSHPNTAVTVMLCPEPEGVMKQERAYVDALGDAVAYRLSEDRLELQDAKGRTLLVYGAQHRADMDPARLVGTAWRLVSMGGDYPLPEPAMTLAFLDDKWLAGYAGCRHYVSAYQASGSDLHMPFTSMLEADCPDGVKLELEGEYTTLLSWVTGYQLSHGQLELLTDRGKSLLFEPLPQEDQASLEGPVWSLVAIVDEDLVKSVPVPLPLTTPAISRTEITIAFQDEVATGSAGCNTYRAGYSYDRTMVAFGPPAATEKYCLTPAGVMEQEQRYLKALDYFTYQIVGDLLWLRTPDGHALVLAASTPGTRSSEIPEGILSKANQIVIARVGEAFFHDYWTFDPMGSRRNEPDPGCLQDPANCGPLAITAHYMIVYCFRVPGQTGVETGAELRLDTSGDLIPWDGATEIPDCASDFRECVFIDEAAAISVARQAGLEPGVGEWTTHFHWYPGEFNTYVWTVQNTLTSDPLGGSGGRILLIDANSGKVLETSEWRMIP